MQLVDAKSLIYRICLPDMFSYVSYVYAKKNKILQQVLKIDCSQHARMHRMHALANGYVNWRVVKST